MSTGTFSLPVSEKTTTFPSPVTFTFTNVTDPWPAGHALWIYAYGTGLGSWATTNYGDWALLGDNTILTGNTRTLTYTPRIKPNSYNNTLPDYCYLVAAYPNSGAVYFSLKATATITPDTTVPPETQLSSRITGKNGRAVFSLNVKDAGSVDNVAMIQLYASLDSLTHQDIMNKVGDSRFNQTFYFGPLSLTPCQIKITNDTVTASSPYFGTCSSTISANGFKAYSDYRLKSNIESLDKTHTVDNIRVVKYTSNNALHYGVIAHELAEVYPDLVSGKKDEESYQSVAYLELIPILINEIQTMKIELEKIKKENEILSSKVERLEQFGY